MKRGKLFYLQLELLCSQLSFFACSSLRCLPDTLPIVSKKLQLYPKKAPIELSAKKIERGEKTPTPKISALLRKRPVLLRANFVLTKDRKRPYYRHFCGKMHRRGLVVKRPGVLSKVQMLNLVLGVGVFSALPKKAPTVSNKAPKQNCKQSNSIARRKFPAVSKQLYPVDVSSFSRFADPGQLNSGL